MSRQEEYENEADENEYDDDEKDQNVEDTGGKMRQSGLESGGNVTEKNITQKDGVSLEDEASDINVRVDDDGEEYKGVLGGEKLNGIVPQNLFEEGIDVEGELEQSKSRKSKQEKSGGLNVSISRNTVSSKSGNLNQYGSKKKNSDSRSEDYDLPELPNILPGQSNANKKSKLAGKIRFPDEDSSSVYTTDSQGNLVKKEKKKGSRSGSSDRSDKTYSSKAAEERARREFERFFPVFRQVDKLRQMKRRGYKPETADFFHAYLHGIKQSDEMREEERRNKDQGFFEQIRKIIEHQDKKTKELMTRLEAREAERRAQVEDKMAQIGQQMFQNFKKEKQKAVQIKSLRDEETAKYLNHLKIDKLPALSPFPGINIVGDMSPSGI